MDAGPLQGVRVVDLTRLLPGGYAGGILADLGADVVKIEDTATGDYIRWGAPKLDGAPPSAAGAHYVALNRGKRSLRVDLKREAGVDVLVRLASQSDVLLEAFRPGVMDRLGVGAARLCELNPRLVYCSLSGFGQQGPLSERAGHDLTYQARAGVLALNGQADGPPIPTGLPIADIGGGSLQAVVAVLAALLERERSGLGQKIDISMCDGALSWAMLEAAEWFAAGIRTRRGSRVNTGALACATVYACRDGGWVALAAMEPKFWEAFCQGVGRTDLLAHHHDPVGSGTHGELQTIFAARTRAEWTSFAEQNDCCLEPVLELEEVLESAALRERDMLVEVQQPGAAPVLMLGSPLKFDRTPARPASSAPVLGADTRAILRELGFNDQQVEGLIDQGAVAASADG